MNHRLLAVWNPDAVMVVMRLAMEAAVDEMWAFAGKKQAPRWLWHAMDHRSGPVLAYVFRRRKEICQPYYDSRESLSLAVF